jgi:hypothetical protein
MALECAPELERDINDRELTPCMFFMHLLPLLRQAHRRRDNGALKKMYDFAGWHLSQKYQHLWSAAGLCFYEHPGDESETPEDFTT